MRATIYLFLFFSHCFSLLWSHIQKHEMPHFLPVREIFLKKTCLTLTCSIINHWKTEAGKITFDQNVIALTVQTRNRSAVWLTQCVNRCCYSPNRDLSSAFFLKSFICFVFLLKDWLCRYPEVEKCWHWTEKWWDGHWEKKHTCAFGVSCSHSSTWRPARVPSSCLRSHRML